MTVESVANYLGKAYTEVDHYKDGFSVGVIAEDLALADIEALRIAAIGTSVTAPDAPTGVGAVIIHATEVEVAWTPPVDDGGAEVRIYTITSTPPSITKQVPASLTLDRISYAFLSGQGYVFHVTATNIVGTGMAGSSASITPNP